MLPLGLDAERNNLSLCVLSTLPPKCPKAMYSPTPPLLPYFNPSVLTLKLPCVPASTLASITHFPHSSDLFKV